MYLGSKVGLSLELVMLLLAFPDVCSVKCCNKDEMFIIQ